MEIHEVSWGSKAAGSPGFVECAPRISYEEKEERVGIDSYCVLGHLKL